MNNQELAHRFANGATEGKGSNMFVDGNAIYSYGRHFVIARTLWVGKKASARKVYLFNTAGYSQTTAKHKGQVSRALHTHERFDVPAMGTDSGLSVSNHKDNLKHYEIEIKRALDSAARANANSDYHLATARSKRHEATRYAQAFKLYLPTFFKHEPENIADIRKRIAAQSAATKKARAIERANAAKMAAQIRALVVPAWIKGEEKVYDPANKKTGAQAFAYTETAMQKLPETYLRVQMSPSAVNAMDGNVETSKGARVTLRAARVLFDMLVNGHDIKGHSIDGYTVIGINGVLTIGCHTIERAEINRFAASQSWEGRIAQDH